MDVSIIETSGLGDRSYLVSQDGTAAVIDPQRDIDRILSLAGERGVTITHVLETHIHNDYVTGGLELSRTVGAEYVVPAGDDVAYDRRPAARRRCHRRRSDPAASHAHSRPHPPPRQLRVARRRRDAVGVFTGGSMLHGTTGRTDLLGRRTHSKR